MAVLLLLWSLKCLLTCAIGLALRCA
jgi:hypothetical protein